MNGLEYATMSQAAAAIRAGETSSLELTRSSLARIELLDGLLNAFITVTADEALAQAGQADRELTAGTDRGPLHGIPVAIKDLIDTRGVLTTYGSRYYAEHVPDEDATVIAALRAAGAVSLGKTGLHELAFGTTSVKPVLRRHRESLAAGSSSGRIQRRFRRQPWRRGWPLLRSAPTLAVPSACPRSAAASSGTSPPTGWSARPASWSLCLPWTMSAR